MTEKEKMIAGKLYKSSDNELAELRRTAHKLWKDYNDTYEDEEEKTDVLKIGELTVMAIATTIRITSKTSEITPKILLPFCSI